MNPNTNKSEIAITKDGEDYIRIIPKLKDGKQLEKDWAYWQNEGRYRYHDKLVILPMSSQFE